MMRCCALILVLLSSSVALAQLPETTGSLPQGSAERGRLVFGPCRTCHYPEQYVGHNKFRPLDDLYLANFHRLLLRAIVFVTGSS